MVMFFSVIFLLCPLLTATFAREEEALRFSPRGYDPKLNTVYPFELTVGYESVAPLDIEVMNDGETATGPISIGLSEGGFFVTDKVSLDSLEKGARANFQVSPVLSLDIGTYSADVTVSGDQGVIATYFLELTVKPEIISGAVDVESLALTETSVKLKIGETPLTLQAIVTPKNATSRDVLWQVTPLDTSVSYDHSESSSNALAVNSPFAVNAVFASSALVLEGILPGAVEVTAQTLDGKNFSLPCRVDISYTATSEVPGGNNDGGGSGSGSSGGGGGCAAGSVTGLLAIGPVAAVAYAFMKKGKRKR
jgi:hypothetical protein